MRVKQIFRHFLMLLQRKMRKLPLYILLSLYLPYIYGRSHKLHHHCHNLQLLLVQCVQVGPICFLLYLLKCISRKKSHFGLKKKELFQGNQIFFKEKKCFSSLKKKQPKTTKPKKYYQLAPKTTCKIIFLNILVIYYFFKKSC